ncbi:hypothetical protein, partial [Nocardia carnea]|uniref:hypothetical protein n=1 Tax=Nocardia carnea TaxID=37328 RepID=UPI0024558F1B
VRTDSQRWRNSIISSAPSSRLVFRTGAGTRTFAWGRLHGSTIHPARKASLLPRGRARGGPARERRTHR